MKAMLSAFAAIAVIAVGAWYGLHQLDFSSSDQQMSEGSVRLN